jgi:hypothetical protein
MIPDPSHDQLERALALFDAELRPSTEFTDWEAAGKDACVLLHRGRRYPGSKIVSIASGLPVSQLGGTPHVARWLRDRRFVAEIVQLPSESVVKSALHDLLLKSPSDGIEPPYAYQHLADELSISHEVRTKRLRNELHWDNRVRFARRKLVDEKRVDGSQHGRWRLARRTYLKIWVEKTNVRGRPDREWGNHALGRALWSPRRAKDGGDIYAVMRDVQPGDLVLHLVDNDRIDGVSVAVGTADLDFVGLVGTEWAGMPGYRIPLARFQRCDPPLRRETFLGASETHSALARIRVEHRGLFYDKEFNLNQGHYLTHAPSSLVRLIDDAYAAAENRRLPYVLEHLNVPEQKASYRAASAVDVQTSSSGVAESDVEIGRRYAPIENSDAIDADISLAVSWMQNRIRLSGARIEVGRPIRNGPPFHVAHEILKRKWIEQDECCALCKRRIPANPANRLLRISADRVESSNGSYDASNVQATHLGCNLARNDASETEWSEFLALIRR